MLITDTGSRIMGFRLGPKLMSLNSLECVVAVILHYFTDFGTFGANYVCDKHFAYRIWFAAIYDLETFRDRMYYGSII